ncbi:hypothetical protein D3C80_1960300 [compost metagenome]
MRLQRGQQVDGDRARCGLAGLGIDVLAQLAGPYLAVLAGDMARQEHGVAGLRGHYIGGGGGVDGRQFDAEAGKGVVDGHVGSSQ